ncbi:type II toxin-antitoxin system mRNA interferase toxin, RelE/StbE family [Candidatus Peregrinibacteria bacterium CG_4_10_14_0_2_um_filter_43_11]|nr:MAG: type II toxin-antitoxin system mRNA interferase toxin, RelE/StbE family [Candidatus Peregrinibacteria bacterium CG_4_10_14_0_2_um_filter_43_11]
MITIFYRASFVRQYRKLPIDVQQETKEKIKLFREDSQHGFLNTHKLEGRLQGRYGFSINYKYRIIFIHLGKNSVAFLAVGDHDIYK